MGTSRQTDRQLQRLHGQPGTAIVVSFDSSTASAALTSGATYLVQCTEDCHIAFAASPTATTNSTPLFAGVPYVFTILDHGVTYKVAAIKATTAGKLYLSPLSGVHA